MTRDEVKRKAKTDGFFLGTQILGYDFQEDTHKRLFEYSIDADKSFGEQTGFPNELVLWSRGHYKTTARTVKIIQLILNFPDIRVLLMQGTIEQTITWLQEIRAHFTGENTKSRLREFFPEFCADRLGTKKQFTVPCRTREGLSLRQPTLWVASRKSVKAGTHFDIGFFSDLVNEQNYKNPKLLDQIWEDFNHFTPLIDPPHFKQVDGTRYVFGDMYERIIRQNQGEWKIFLADCWKPGTKEPIFPRRQLASGRWIGFTREMLEEQERIDPETFAAQMLNKPISARSHLFPADKIRARRIPVIPAGLSCPVMFLDLASSRREESDHRVILVGKLDINQNMYVTRVVGGHYPPGELAKKIIEVALEEFPFRVMIEKTAPAVYLAELVKVIAQVQGLVIPIDFIEVNNQPNAKYYRVAGITPFLERLFFGPNLEMWDRLVEEFDRFSMKTIGGHNDYPDTVGLMVQWFSKNMPLMRPDPMQAAFAQNPYTSPSEIHTQMPVSSSEYSLGSDFLS